MTRTATSHAPTRPGLERHRTDWLALVAGLLAVSVALTVLAGQSLSVLSAGVGPAAVIAVGVVILVTALRTRTDEDADVARASVVDDDLDRRVETSDTTLVDDRDESTTDTHTDVIDARGAVRADDDFGADPVEADAADHDLGDPGPADPDATVVRDPRG